VIALSLLALLAGGMDDAPVQTPPQIMLGQCLDDAINNADYGECYSAAIDKADGELNAVWKLLMAELSEQPEAGESLREEQRKWIAFKEDSCSFYWDEGFGSMHRSIIGPACRLDVIEMRTGQLNAILIELEAQ
jgi:uncharacterized protein YecT (DUF1311 family)